MIESLLLLRNIGKFESVQAANIALKRCTLVYAENGRGKTTLTAVLRSLATGEAIHITERRRLTAQHAPHVVLSCTDGPNAMFQNGAWTRTVPNLVIFDDRFVDDNVHSGLAIDFDHRQNLHELILGEQGVLMNRELQEAVAQITTDNTALRLATAAIPDALRLGLTVDQFCVLPGVPDVDAAIERAERALRSARQATAIQNGSEFVAIPIPTFDAAAINAMLARDLAALDAQTVERVHDHCLSLGTDGEEWIAKGMQILSEGTEPDNCPFCEQPLLNSPSIDDYRAYFGEEYARLKDEIVHALGDAEAKSSRVTGILFERGLRAARENQRFWSDFIEVAPIEVNEAQITHDWERALNEVLRPLHAKNGAPLDRRELSPEAIAAINAFNVHSTTITQLNERLTALNPAIREVKRTAAAANFQQLQAALNSLKSAKERHTAATNQLCETYLHAMRAKTQTEQRRETAKAALQQYRQNVFPQYRTAINNYLTAFNAGFRIGQVQPRDTSGGPTCVYDILIDNQPVSVSGQPGEPCFRSTLSGGDRNTLALAFFFASLDLDAALATKTIVIDDPLSSLDDHRTAATIDHIRGLGLQVEQLIVLSHSKPFLCELHRVIDRDECAAITIIRGQAGSTFNDWNVTADSQTLHDIRHEQLKRYLVNGPAGLNGEEMARSIRHHLEAYLRVAHPDTFPVGSLLGNFREICDQRYGAVNQILNQHDINELRELTNYSNRFHHDTNPAWRIQIANDQELQNMIGRLFAFIQR